MDKPKQLEQADYQAMAINITLASLPNVVSKTLGAPFDRVKLLLQCQPEMTKTGRLSTPYTGIANCISRVAKDEGLLSFFRGNFPNIIRYYPTQAVSFTSKELIRGLGPSQKENPQGWMMMNFASGAAAGALTMIVGYPFDYARVRLANDINTATGRQFNGMTDAWIKTVKSDGIPGLYRGWGVSLTSSIIYRGLYFGLYDSLRDNFWAVFALGYAVTMTAGLATYPLDTAIRRMMMRSLEPVKYKHSIAAMKEIVQTEGVKSLFRGAWMNILKSFVGAGTLVAFDAISSLVNSRTTE